MKRVKLPKYHILVRNMKFEDKKSHRLLLTTQLQKNLEKSQRHVLVKMTMSLSLWLSRHIYRIIEIVIAVIVTLLTMPLCLILLLRRGMYGQNVFVEQKIVGRLGVSITIRYFNITSPLASSLALFFHVLSGKLALIGSTMKSLPQDIAAPENGYLHTMKPGVISLWQVRKNSKIGHEGFLATEWEYHFTRSAISDLFLFLRAIPTYIFKNAQPVTSKVIDLFGVLFVNLTMKEAVQLVGQKARQKEETDSVFFVNPDCLNKTFADRPYLHILENGDYVFPDGIGLTIACKLLRSPLRENVNGTDMLPFLCEMAVQKDLSLFLLGAKPGVAEEMSTQLQQKYSVSIAGTHHGYFDYEQESEAVIDTINRSGADIILVAFGAPLQERWIATHKAKLKAGVAMGVGGLFDFYSGNTKRAPRWLRELGLEWVYRIAQEPGRMWRRYVIGNPLFLYRVLKWKAKSAKKQRQIHNSAEDKTRVSRIENVSSTLTPRQYRTKILVWRQSIRIAKLIKRIFDFTCATLLLIILAPIFLATAIAIYLESPGPVFYSQTRVGKNGKYFKLYKFRSMVVDADKLIEKLQKENESSDGVIFKMKTDPRITKTGRFIRKFSIDELPQILNVMVGDMSLLGPRPALPSEVEKYSLEQRKRLHVLPGITCIWQVSGRSDIPFTGQVQLDIQYIQSTSIWQDIAILAKTIPAVLSGKGAY
jgi:exopolysaccharide biosynthesis WecB/TagA/CpsF family protein